MKRLCIFCKYFYFYESSPHYSDLTPGIDSDWGCSKNVWDKGDVEDIRIGNEYAFDCKLYELSDDARELGAPE